MARLRDTRTGVVVNVDDASAANLGVAYEPAEEPKKSTAKKASSSSKSSKSEK